MSKKVLVIDDDRAILDVVKIILEEKKYQVITSTNANVIYELQNSGNIPDILLLDIWISGNDGREIAHYMKSQKSLSHIPIVFVSAHNETEKIAKEAGATDFLPKPFDIDALIKMIEKYTS